MNAFDRVCAVLDQQSVPYALIGAAALAAHGVARSTFDIDLLTTDRRVLEPESWTALSESIDIRRGDLDDPLAGVVRVSSEGERPIDIVVGKHDWQTRAVERAERSGGTPVVQARDLVLLKLYAGGSQDLWDVRELLQVSDRALLSQVADDVLVLSPDAQRRWDEIRRQ